MNRNFPALWHFMRFLFCIPILFAVSCNDDDIPEPYQPVTNLPKIKQLEFVSGTDSSIFVFDTDMVLISGRSNKPGFGYEWFTMQYSEKGQLTGAEYNTASSSGGHRDFYQVTYSRNNRNMLSGLSREGWTKTFSFAYDDSYRLNRITFTEGKSVIRHTVEYDDQSNVLSVETYKNTPSDSYEKSVCSDYDDKRNPFRFLVNVFFAPYFSSNSGVIFFDNIPPGMLLSRNNPGQIKQYIKNGEEWTETGTAVFHRENHNEDGYPTQIDGDLSMEIRYLK